MDYKSIDNIFESIKVVLESLKVDLESIDHILGSKKGLYRIH
jgi:hypothetical protein